MLPVITVLGRTVSTYTLCILAGGLTAGFVGCRAASRRGEDDNNMICMLLLASAASAVGGWLLYLLVTDGYFDALVLCFKNAASLPDLIKRLAAVGVGLVSFGGIAGGICASLAYLRAKKLPVGMYTDMLAPLIPLFHAFGRVGCFFAGCCYGREWKYGVTFTRSLSPAANDVARFPVALLEAVFNLCLFALLGALLKRNILRGRLLPLYLALYSAGRFFIELLRGDAERGTVLSVPTGQLLSIAVLVGSVSSLVLLSRKRKDGTA